MDKEIWRAISDEVERQREEIFEDLRRLVRTPSVTGSEGTAQAIVAELLRDAGMSVEMFEADPDTVKAHPAYIEVPWGYEGRPNVIGMLAGSGGGKSLILNGHIDVVSPEPVDHWTHDPWGGEIVGGKLFGRGSCDMKGGIVAGIAGMRALVRLGLEPAGTVLFQSVIEEEAGGGGGTLACFLKGYTADAAWMLEPDQSIAVAHAGILYCRITVRGKTAHAGKAHTGVNAAEKLSKIHEALRVLDVVRASTCYNALMDDGSGRCCHINVGVVRAGDWPSTVPGLATLECRLSFVPGEDMALVKRQVESVVSQVAKEDSWLRDHPPTIEWFGWRTNPWEQDPKHEFVTTFATVSSRVLGREVSLCAKSAGLDTRFAGLFGVPAIAFGCLGDNIHGSDEFVNLDSVIQCAKIAGTLIVEWCGIGK